MDAPFDTTERHPEDLSAEALRQLGTLDADVLQLHYQRTLVSQGARRGYRRMPTALQGRRWLKDVIVMIAALLVYYAAVMAIAFEFGQGGAAVAIIGLVLIVLAALPLSRTRWSVYRARRH